MSDICISVKFCFHIPTAFTKVCESYTAGTCILKEICQRFTLEIAYTYSIPQRENNEIGRMMGIEFDTCGFNEIVKMSSGLDFWLRGCVREKIVKIKIPSINFGHVFRKSILEGVVIRLEFFFWSLCFVGTALNWPALERITLHSSQISSSYSFSIHSLFSTHSLKVKPNTPPTL